VVGAVLVIRPFASLTVLILLVVIGFVVSGVTELAGRSEEAHPRVATIAGIAWIAAGAAILLWPGMSLQLLAIVVGIAIIVGGIGKVVASLRGEVDQRWAARLLGLASVALGVVALGWPDVTVLVVAVVFGIRMVLFGLARIGDGIRGRVGAPSERHGRLGRWVRTAGAALALVVALGLAYISVSLNRGQPVVDAFYDPPPTVPDEPGRLIRSEPFTRVVPDGARAWRILYTTTRGDGIPAVASALVAAPTNGPDGPVPVIAWSHGTTGVDRTCAPSLLPTGIESGSPNAIDQVLANGWVMVSTDYTGLGTEAPHAYLVGEQAGRSVLDAVRAAHDLPELDLGDRTVVWGHSQGGGAALWAGMLAATYAPDANVIGVAALSPASDLPEFIGSLAEINGGSIFASFAIQGYSDAYPDVAFNDYVRPTAQLQAREIAARCLTSEAAVSVIQTLLFGNDIWSTDPSTGPFARRLAENVPLGPIEAPLLIGQGAEDPLIPASVQASYAQRRCDAGYAVDYREYPGEDHIGVVEPDSPLIPELIAWTKDRLAGRPPTPTCGEPDDS
jgi:uncharacterized membrane protein HdeD (DUF308 family)/acetyl esterase/lipase